MIYLDNGATSFPKAPGVDAAVYDCLKNYCGNPGRSGHRYSVMMAEKIYECRQSLAKLINAQDCWERIVLTSGTTASLNIAVKGLAREGDHILTTSMEHNSVLRPVLALEKRGIKSTVIRCSAEGMFEPEKIRKHVRPETCLIVCTQASNVTGSITDLKEVVRIARELEKERNKPIYVLADCAQSMGVMEIDIKNDGPDLLAFSGHKGLLGPQGTGGLFIGRRVNLETVFEGGTGTESLSVIHPEEYPEKFEAGTLNGPGFVGLSTALGFIEKNGVQKIGEWERELTAYMDSGLRNMKGVTVYGPENSSEKVAVTSISVRNLDSEYVSGILDREFQIAVRSGYHCAALAHNTIGSQESGTVRICPGPFSEKRDIKRFLEAVRKISNKSWR